MLHKLKIVAVVSLFGVLAWIGYYLWINPKILQYSLIGVGVLFGLILFGKLSGNPSTSTPPYDDWVERKQQVDFRNHITGDKF